jgi:hypothetical protein
MKAEAVDGFVSPASTSWVGMLLAVLIFVIPVSIAAGPELVHALGQGIEREVERFPYTVRFMNASDMFEGLKRRMT